MKFIRTYLVLVLFIVLSGCGGIQPTLQAGFDTDASRHRKIDEYFNTLTDLGQFNGVVLVQDEDSKPYIASYNLNSTPDASTYVTSTSQFDIHSVSKLMAKVIIHQLEEEGQLSRTDLLNTHISDFPRGDEITIQHLLDNTSGLPREPKIKDTTKNKLTDEEIVEWAKQQALEFKPGTNKLYSNTGYELLYYIIGQINSTSFPEYVKNNLFKDLKMTQSGTHYYTDKSNLTQWVKNHQMDHNLMVVENITEDDFKQSMLYSTAQDLLKFLRYTSTRPFKEILKNQEGVIAWTGGSEGIRAYVHADVDQDYSFVILANYDDIPLNDIIQTTSRIMESKPYELPRRINRESIVLNIESLKKYVGTYDFVEADHLLLDFKVKNNSLALYQEEELIAELFAESDGVFFADPASEESFEFSKDDNAQTVIAGWKGIKLKGIRK